MKMLVLFGCAVVLVLFVAVPGHTELIVNGVDSNGNQLIYDTGLNITWYDYTYHSNGWDDGMSWAAGLNAAGVTGWRLPTNTPVNASTYNENYSRNGSTDYGYNISAPGSAFPASTASEMAYLYYIELGDKAAYDVNGNLQSGGGLVNRGPFKNLQADFYWSGTGWASDPGGYSFYFQFIDGGYQGPSLLASNLDALAVHSGDVLANGTVLPNGPIPIPGAIFLFAPGLAGLAAIRRKFKKEN